MISNSELRARARDTLGSEIFGEKWLFALLVCLIYSAITSILTSATVGLTLIIVFGPLSVGLSGVFLSAVRNKEKVSIENMFNGFKDFTSTFLLGLMVTLFTLLWSLLFIIPGIVKAYSYSMAFYIKNDHPEYDFEQCINESKRMMNGYKGKLFSLHVSFIGWLIVGALCLGVGTLWVYPYIQMATTEFYNELKAKDPASL